MIIDGHAHAAGKYSTSESIRQMTSTFKIDKVVLCPSPKNRLDLAEPPNLPFMKSPSSIYFLNKMLRLGYRAMKDNGDGNMHVNTLKDTLPDQVAQFLWVNPLDQLHISRIEQNIKDYQVKGIKLHQAWDSFAIDGDEFSRVVEVAKTHRLPIFIHLFSKHETSKLLQFMRGNQGVVFIIAHMLGLDIFREARGLLKNVYFDTSGSQRVRGEDILRAINDFGYDHVIFGSDTPYAEIGDQITKIQSLGLSQTVLDHVFRLNMEGILALGL